MQSSKPSKVLSGAMLNDMKDMKTILILLSDAPGFCAFFPCVGDKLEELGHKVIYAVDSSHAEFIARNSRSDIKIFNLCDTPSKAEQAPYKINMGAMADWERLDCYYGLENNTNLALKRWLSRCNQFPEWIWERAKFDIVLSESDAGIYTTAFHRFCLERNLVWAGFEASRINGYWEFPDSNLQFSNDDAKIRENVERYMRSILSPVITSPSYMNASKLGSLTNTSLMGRFVNREKIKEYQLALRSTFNGNLNSLGRRPTSKGLAHLKFIIRRKVSSTLKGKGIKVPKINERSIFFPLHFHPEASTSIRAPEFLNEVSLLFFISSYLPEEITIYVKEHPSMNGLRSAAELKRISTLPNVVLLPSSVSTTTLIDECELCVTLTSTAAFEALIRGKPVVILGDVFFETHRNCRRARTKKQAVEQIFCYFNASWRPQLAGLEAYNSQFIAQHLKEAMEFSLNFYETSSFRSKGAEFAEKLLNAVPS